jgi:GR25 family glycosyltransferase involved in LPS biosynthesis
VENQNIGETMTFDDVDIFILTHPSKKCLTHNYLEGLTYSTYVNEDWRYDQKFKMHKLARPLKDVRKNEKGHFRCYRGHQEMLKKSVKPYTLIFEDDAVPKEPLWKDIIKNSFWLLEHEGYELISYHSRIPKKYNGFIKKRFRHQGHQYIELFAANNGVKWGLGSLCYIIKNNVKNKIINKPYCGIPIDIFIMNFFNCCILHPSCFHHERRHGSIIESSKIPPRK